MTLNEAAAIPRRDAMIRWHKQPTADGTPSWYAEVNGRKVAEAVMTGRAGVDNYPWDWGLTEARTGVRSSGVSDTLRSAKEYVAAAIR